MKREDYRRMAACFAETFFALEQNAHVETVPAMVEFYIVMDFAEQMKSAYPTINPDKFVEFYTECRDNLRQ